MATMDMTAAAVRQEFASRGLRHFPELGRKSRTPRNGQDALGSIANNLISLDELYTAGKTSTTATGNRSITSRELTNTIVGA